MASIGRAVALAALLAISAGCQPTTSTRVPLHTGSSPSPHPTPTPLPGCPLAVAADGPEVLKAGLSGPDDLVFDKDGRLLFSDIRLGTVSALNADGTVVVIAGGLSAPEGMVLAADGRLLVAEQGRNRVIAVDMATGSVSPWRVFPNRSGRDGLDGIGPLLPNGDIVVPDSPNGVVWRVSGDGKTETRIGSGMTRPVGAAADRQGRIFVADEGGALWVLEPAQRRFLSLRIPDDVLVGRDGHLFVNTIGDGAIHEVDGQQHTIRIISGIRGPQGIALDGADNLYYTEFDAGRIDRVLRTFILDEPTVSNAGDGTEIICPRLRRAADFRDALSLTPAPGGGTTVLQLHQPGIDSSGALRIRTSQKTLSFSIAAGQLHLSQTVPIP